MLTTNYQIREREYVIHDKPREDQPYRRIIVEGADVLSVKELLHIALGGDFESDHALNEYGTQFLTTLHSVTQIKELLHVTDIQATRLYAMLSLGKRLYAPSQSSLLQVRGIEDVYNHYRMLASLAKEQLWILLINSRYQVVHEEVLAIGTIESLHIRPRDIFQSAIERRVTAVILLHNHPSGNPEPSSADLQFTQNVQEAANILGIELLDHVIVAEQGYTSCLQQSIKTVDKE